MTNIKKYKEQIEEELDGAKHYIEIALEYKAMGNGNPDNMDRYNTYKAMSIQELEHATRLHQYAVQDVKKLKAVYPDVPPSMQDKWDKTHEEFVEKSAWIKQMQSM